MISFVALILSMSVSGSIGSFRTVSVQFGPITYSVIRDTACQSSRYSGREREHCIGNNIISYASFSDKSDK